MITSNARIGVSHDGHIVNNLHIHDEEWSDDVQYMCKINTLETLSPEVFMESVCSVRYVCYNVYQLYYY